MKLNDSIVMEIDNTKVTLTKVKEHEKIGEYKQTKIDAEKKEVDFRLLSVSPNSIIWEDGTVETVNKRKLTKLQKEFTWTTDF